MLTFGVIGRTLGVLGGTFLLTQGDFWDSWEDFWNPWVRGTLGNLMFSFVLFGSLGGLLGSLGVL